MKIQAGFFVLFATKFQKTKCVTLFFKKLFFTKLSTSNFTHINGVLKAESVTLHLPFHLPECKVYPR